MLRRAFIAISLLWWSGTALAADIVDATGRNVQVPEHIERVLPAGPPAAILLAVLAPDLMLGWTSPVSDEARAYLSPEAATLPQVPRLTGRDDVIAKVVALKPDLIVDYGTVSPRYADLARATQQRTGVPTLLLDGSLTEIPHVFRLLGGVLHREGQRGNLGEARRGAACGTGAPGWASACFVCAWHRRPDRRRTGNRSRGHLHPPRLAGGRASWSRIVPPGQLR